MPGEFFFMATAGLGVSLAGFGGLIATLTPEQQRSSAIARYRIGNVVVWGLEVTFFGFSIIALHAVLDDVVLTTRVASGIAAVMAVFRAWRADRPGPEWPDERVRRLNIAFDVVFTLVVLGNVAVGNVGYLQVIVLLLLWPAAGLFVTAVKEATRDVPAKPDQAE